MNTWIVCAEPHRARVFSWDHAIKTLRFERDIPHVLPEIFDDLHKAMKAGALNTLILCAESDLLSILLEKAPRWIHQALIGTVDVDLYEVNETDLLSYVKGFMPGEDVQVETSPTTDLFSEEVESDEDDLASGGENQAGSMRQQLDMCERGALRGEAVLRDGDAVPESVEEWTEDDHAAGLQGGEPEIEGQSHIDPGVPHDGDPQPLPKDKVLTNRRIA